MVTEERVRQVPVTVCRIVEEERVEPYEVRVCKWVCEKQTVRVPRVVRKQVPVTYTYRVPKTVVMALLDYLLEKTGHEGIRQVLASPAGPEPRMSMRVEWVAVMKAR
mgnify:CR=1 FL=1